MRILFEAERSIISWERKTGRRETLVRMHSNDERQLAWSFFCALFSPFPTVGRSRADERPRFGGSEYVSYSRSHNSFSLADNRPSRSSTVVRWWGLVALDRVVGVTISVDTEESSRRKLRTCAADICILVVRRSKGYTGLDTLIQSIQHSYCYS